MSIFNFFGRNDNKSKEEPSNTINPVVKKMQDWIEHPMEFNKPPDKIKVIDSRKLFWPTQRLEMCHLLEFFVDDEKYIGFTGPITWSFIGINFDSMSIEDLYLRYTGWYTVFAVINQENYNKAEVGTDQQFIVNNLENQGYSGIEVLQVALLGAENYYEFKAQKEGRTVKVVGTHDNLTQFDQDHILPYYEFIGVQWGPFEIE